MPLLSDGIVCERPSQLNAVVFIFAHCFSMTSKRKSYSLEDKKWVIEWIISEGDGIPLTEFELLEEE